MNTVVRCALYPRVDDVIEGFLDPLGRLLRAEVVEHQHVGLHHGPKHVHLGNLIHRIVGAADDAQQVARVVEDAASTAGRDDLTQDRDGQMGLADAGRSQQEQPPIDDRKTLREPRRMLQCLGEPLVVRDVVGEIAVLISTRDSRLCQQASGSRLAHAITASHARHTVGFDRLPTSVVAQNAVHNSRS